MKRKEKTDKTIRDCERRRAQVTRIVWREVEYASVAYDVDWHDDDDDARYSNDAGDLLRLVNGGGMVFVARYDD